jgi:hypothetical protein
MRMRNARPALSLTILLLASCGGGPRTGMLESITVVPGTGAPGVSFTATGHYSTAPATENNITVAWFQSGPVINPYAPDWSYSMSSGPFQGTCYSSAQPYTSYVVAYAPTNPDAPANGKMPFTVFQNLVVYHTVTQQGGFVAGVATLSCP